MFLLKIKNKIQKSHHQSQAVSSLIVCRFCCPPVSCLVSSAPAVAKTSAPTYLAYWIATRPTPPAAAWIKTWTGNERFASQNLQQNISEQIFKKPPTSLEIRSSFNDVRLSIINYNQHIIQISYAHPWMNKMTISCASSHWMPLSVWWEPPIRWGVSWKMSKSPSHHGSPWCFNTNSYSHPWPLDDLGVPKW